MGRVRLKGWADVGARVATARERAGFTQRELGDRIGLGRSAITRIELGQRQLDALELAQIADALASCQRPLPPAGRSSVASG
jgi:transcriptional regulator with XRE-family HTH domain